MKVHSYGKVWALGHMQAEGLLMGTVVVQEKLDGSQFSFGNIGGELCARSKGAAVGEGGNVEGMFSKAYKTADLIFRTGTVPENMVVRGEVLEKPKHNSLTYNRTPTGNIIIWDITLNDGSESYLPPHEVKRYADMWGMEVVPTYHIGALTTNDLKQSWEKYWSKKDSVLGGPIEGIVIKNYARTDGMGKMLCAKIVREEFKELNNENWKSQQTGSVIDQIIASFNRENIWKKAIQHAQETGVLTNSAKDIGYLIGAVKRDFGTENGKAIKKRIFKEFYSDIERGIMKGFPEWYKAKLLDEALNKES
jgi:RNA ligase